MKPTYDAISLEGQKTFAPSFDTFGFFARSVEDLQLLADVFALEDDEPARDVPLKDVYVALIKTPMWLQAGAGAVAAMGKAAIIPQKCGVQVEDVSFPGSPEGNTGNKANLAAEICDLVENTANYSHKEKWKLVIRTLICGLNNLAAKYSVIPTPSAVDEGPLGFDNMGRATFDTLWTAKFHMPAINIPAFRGANGMPIGISLVAPQFRDQHLLRISKIIGEVLMDDNGGRHASSDSLLLLSTSLDAQDIVSWAGDLMAELLS
ncbi:amidase signature domain-containing protein [Aspergillus cavernicola]|uniref:Amidase signature domain-containing protein n=1 Tax=Aspergillus cavernicola TaxID=176166 RepID=A0ABR4IFG9_9EURO